MKKLSLFSLSFSLTVFAATTTNPVTAPGVDLSTAKASVGFLAVGQPSAMKIRGQATEEIAGKRSLQGVLTLQGTQLTGTAKLALDSLDTGIGMRTRHMKEKYLETGKFPESELKLTKLELPAAVKEANFSAKGLPFTGELKLHGQTKPVSGTVDVEKKDGKAELAFAFKVKSSEFGIPVPEFMGIKVADEVAVDVALQDLTM